MMYLVVKHRRCRTIMNLSTIDYSITISQQRFYVEECDYHLVINILRVIYISELTTSAFKIIIIIIITIITIIITISP